MLLRSCIHRPHSTVGTLWTVINVTEQIINYQIYDRSFLVKAEYTCVKNGCAAFEQIMRTETEVFLFAKASHTKLTLSPQNYLSWLHSKHLCWRWYKKKYINIGRVWESQTLFPQLPVATWLVSSSQNPRERARDLKHIIDITATFVELGCK